MTMMQGWPDPDAPPEKKYFGKYKGYIRDNADPQNRGRVRCFCPQVMGPQDDAEHWLGWAEGNFPWMGGINTIDFGAPYTKEQQITAFGSEYIGVWIEFEQGQVDFPIWCGTWLVAPTPTSENAQQDLTNAATLPGGDIVDNPPAGSALDALNPPKPDVPSTETRLMVKAGREIIIGSVDGGSILIGPYGVSINGVQILENGRMTTASTADGVVG